VIGISTRSIGSSTTSSAWSADSPSCSGSIAAGSDADLYVLYNS
jgi:hypothetical protein